MRQRFDKLRQLFSTKNENTLLPNRRRLRIEPLEARRVLSLGTLHVDADSVAPTPDGADWATAYPDLQAALDQAAVLNTDADAANDITALWIAEGTYKPTAQLDPADPRSATFSMLDAVSLYGEFYGDESDRAFRHGGETTLSGDLDATGDLSDGDAYTIVYASEITGVTLDALTITGGNADGSHDANHSERSFGGGIYNSGTLMVTDSTISNNSASRGGGISNSGTLTVTDSTISGNSAMVFGGGVYMYDGTLSVTDSTISGNSAVYGGGIYDSGTLTVTGSTIAGNSANRGGGIRNIAGWGTLTVQNTILAGNTAGDTGPDVVGQLEIVSSNNLIGMNPKFTRDPSPGADGQWGTEDDDFGDLRLTGQSPAINKGDNALAVDPQGNPLLIDLDGSPRVHGSAVDIGAYEFQGEIAPGRETPSLVVDTLDDVVDLYDDRISLREAILYADADSLGTHITFDPALDNGEILLATGSLLLDRTVQIDATALTSLTINAQVNSRVVTNMAADVELLGLTLVGGKADNGGGIYNYEGVLAVTDSTISGNSAESSGGGIFNSYGTLSVTGSTISNNSASSHGGGVYNNGTLTITDSKISENSATGFIGPGGILSSSFGGGISSSSGMLTVTNSTISGNSAGSQGGGIHNSYGTLTVTSSTIAGNSTGNGGGGIYNRSGTLTVTNSIVSLNADANVADIEGSLTVDSGFNLIGVDPRFARNPSPGADGIWGTADDDLGDLHLTAESPAINFGDNGAVPAELLTDLDGLPRIHGGRVDIGAYEYQADPPAGREMPSAVVTTLADTVDLYDDLISLREALFYGSVEEIVGPITFDAALDAGEITLAGNSLSVDRSVQIDASALSSLSVNADSRSRLFTILAGTVDLVGLTITGGSAWDGGGIYNSGTLTVTGSAISGNSADRNGGGIYNYRGGTLTLTGSTISGNSAGQSGGGIDSYGTLTVTGSTISGNSAEGSGGGVCNRSGTLTVTSSTISDNSGAWDGGGISNWGTLTVTGSILSGNSAFGLGGGIRNDGTLTVTDSTISGNSVDYYGGGIYSHGVLTVTSSTISGNSAEQGGGIYNYSTLTVTDSTISGNSARFGGGILDEGTLTVTNSTISDNSAARDGGGIYSSRTLTVTNSTILGNSAEHGGGMYGSGTWTVIGSTFSGNSAYVGGGIYVSSAWAWLTVHNTIIAANTTDTDGPDVYGSLRNTSSHNLIGDGGNMSGIEDGVNGNLVGTAESPIHPRFVRMPSPGADGQWGTEDDDYGDLHLLPDSPAIDAGDDAWAVDPDGNPLLTDLDGNPRISGWRVDMGAYEFQFPPCEILGTVFFDRDGDGTRDQREPGMARWEVYLDQNENGSWDPDELSVLTGLHGDYAFTDLPVGTYTVGLSLRKGWTQTSPNAGGFHTVTVEPGQTVEDVLFGNRPGRRAARGPNGSNSQVFSEDSDWLSQFDLPAPKSSRLRGPKAAAVDTLMAIE